MKSFLAATTTVLGSVLLSTVAGCAAESTATTTASAPVSHPEVVALDFYNGGSQASASCSGTLLAPSVVLTTATCAVGTWGATVHAPDAQNQSSDVSRVYAIDWTPNGDHTIQHDLALVILTKDITLPATASYPKVWSHNADGISATQVHRKFGVAASKAKVQFADVSIAKGRPVRNPYTLYVHDADLDVGGPLLGQDANGKPAVVGVMLGVGNRTAGGYVARVADPTVRSWIANVVANPSWTPSAGASTAPSLAKMETLDDDDDDGSGGGDQQQPQQQQQDQQNPPQQDQQQNPTTPADTTTTTTTPADTTTTTPADTTTTAPATTTTDTPPAQTTGSGDANAANSASSNTSAPQNPANVMTYQAPDGTTSTYNLEDPTQLKAAQAATGFGDSLQPAAPPSTAETVLSTVSGWVTPAPQNMTMDGPVACICIRG